MLIGDDKLDNKSKTILSEDIKSEYGKTFPGFGAGSFFKMPAQ